MMACQMLPAGLVTAPIFMHSASYAEAALADCDPKLGPDRKLNYKQVKSDSGVVTSSFLGVAVWGKTYQVEHGIDVHSDSPYEIDMKEIARCGGKFVAVRISGESRRLSHNNYRAMRMWREARQAGLDTIPYHYLGASPFRRAPFPLPNNDDLLRLLSNARVEGQRQAKIFLADYSELLVGEVASKGRVSHWRPNSIVLDLEEALPEGSAAKKSEIGRQQFGLAYAQMACSWIQEVRTALPSSDFVIYTGAYVVRDYEIFRGAYVSGDCLTGVPIWLAATPRGGGHPADDAAPVSSKVARQTCFSLNRSSDSCVVHQYTHFGAVGSRQVDLNRLHVAQIEWDRQSIGKR